MTIEEQLFTVVASISDYTAIVGARFYPVIGPENEAYAGPFAVWMRTGNTSSESLSGPSGYAEVHYQFSHMARAEDGGLKTVRAMTEALRLGLTGYRGGDIYDISQVIDHDGFDANYMAYVSISEFKVAYREAQS